MPADFIATPTETAPTRWHWPTRLDLRHRHDLVMSRYVPGPVTLPAPPYGEK